nr:hypothetical protein 158p1_00118 [Serratia entomophila]ULG14499.1 hypothetical protein 142p_00082 [Serratia proteamaculans]ULG10662.1 hypothetical protein 176p_00118 [Serratia entomophila]ULG10882.1 hypothetical protein 210p_00005 [Serratia entomophila]ULG11186.1 hypothetical protein 345p_00071 [Serratia entomophila]
MLISLVKYYQHLSHNYHIDPRSAFSKNVPQV